MLELDATSSSREDMVGNERERDTSVSRLARIWRRDEAST